MRRQGLFVLVLTITLLGLTACASDPPAEFKKEADDPSFTEEYRVLSAEFLSDSPEIRFRVADDYYGYFGDSYDKEVDCHVLGTFPLIEADANSFDITPLDETYLRVSFDSEMELWHGEVYFVRSENKAMHCDVIVRTVEDLDAWLGRLLEARDFYTDPPAVAPPDLPS